MNIKKIYNNNIILAEDEKRLEHIILGRGIAFQQKRGDQVNHGKIEKIFELKSNQTMSKFLMLLNEVPINHLELATRIIEEAEKDLQTKFDDSIYIGLTDHINYAIERFKKEVPLKNALLWEIRKFYDKEFRAAKHSLEIINYYEGIWLDEDEAGYIALHFVNAQQHGADMQQILVTTEVTEEIMKIINYSYRVELDNNSLNYGRFLTHINFFLKRIFSQEIVEESEDATLYYQVLKKYPEASSCVNKIVLYLERKFHIQIHQEEKMYLILHVQRLNK